MVGQGGQESQKHGEFRPSALQDGEPRLSIGESHQLTPRRWCCEKRAPGPRLWGGLFDIQTNLCSELWKGHRRSKTWQNPRTPASNPEHRRLRRRGSLRAFTPRYLMPRGGSHPCGGCSSLVPRAFARESEGTVRRAKPNNIK